jgi:hypothetical protein
MRGPVAPAALRLTTIAAAILLAAAAIGWAAFPLHGGRGGTRVALVAAIITAALSIARLATIDVPPLSAPGLATLSQRLLERLLEALESVPWAEGMVLAVLVLEALHAARAWHTALLGLALLGYLFAVHLAETHAGPAVLRGQLPLIAAGLGLMGLAVGAAALPGLPTGTASLLAGAGSVVAIVVIATLSMPGTGSDRG